MAEQTPARIWTMRAMFVLIALAILFFRLLPLHTLPRGWAGPDLFLAVVAAWSLRRRRAVPVWLVAALALLGDLLLQRPPGLWAAMTVVASEWFKAHSRQLRDQTFVTEWITVGTVLVAMAVGYSLALALTVTQGPPLGLFTMQIVATWAVYPLVVGISNVVFGIRKPQPGDLESLGRQGT